MAATHEHNIHTGVNRVLESVKSPSCLACLYQLIIPRLSRADTLNPTCQTPMWLDSRRMSRESLTVGFLLLFKEPPLLEPRVLPYLRFVAVDVCASLYPVSNGRFEFAFASRLRPFPKFHGDELSCDIWTESTQRALVSLRARMLPDSIIPLS